MKITRRQLKKVISETLNYHRSTMQKAIESERQEHLNRLENDHDYSRGYRYAHKFVRPPYVDELSGIVDYSAIDFAMKNVLRVKKDGVNRFPKAFEEGFYKVFEEIEESFMKHHP